MTYSDHHPCRACGAPAIFDVYDGADRHADRSDCPGEWEDDGPRTFSLDTVAALIRDAGFPATVEQTGGGCATLYAGRRGEDENGNESADVIVGPGWFTSGGFGGGAGATFDPAARCAPFTGATADDVECALAGRDGDVVLYAEDVKRGASIPHALAAVAISMLDPRQYHG